MAAKRTDYRLTEAEAGLLEAATKEALGTAGLRGGAVGGGIGGALGSGGAAGAAGAAGGASGGRAGGRFGARLTKPQTAETELELSGGPEQVRASAREAIVADGAVIDDPNRAGDGSVWGIVGSGARNMMPALVRVGVEPAGPGSTRVQIRATGREGLIKQRIGAKAAERIAAAISAP